MAGLSLPTMVLLITGEFHTWLTIVLGVVAAVAVCLVVGPDRRTVSRFEVVSTVVAVVGAGFWVVVNAMLSSQDIVVSRDPATYANTSQWLAQHASLPIPTAAGIFHGVPGLLDASLGFQAVAGGGAVDPQGNHLVIALVALVGGVFGSTALLKANCLLGGLALLAFFGLLKRFVGPGWALFGMVVLGGSMPMLHFSRSVFTEPFTLAMVMGGLSLLWRAHDTGRLRDFAAAGLVLGTSAMARIDGSVTLLFVPLLVTLLVALAPKGQWRPAGRRALALVAGVAVPSAIGLIDLQQLAPGYADDLATELGEVQKALAALLALGIVFVVIDRRFRLLDRLLSRRWLPAAAAGGVVLYAAVLASRPLWYVGHGFAPAGNPSIGALQKALSLKVEPTRSYDELSVNWLAWYYGWPMLVAAVLGLAFLVHRCLTRRDLQLAPVVLLLLIVGSLYFWRVSIIPDQIWAVRRFLPVVIPLLLLSALVAAAQLWARGLVPRVLSGLLAAALIVIPLVVTRPLVKVREYVPQLDQIRAVCDALPARAAVLLIDDAAQQQYAVTLRSYCGVDTVGLTASTPAVLALARTTAAASGHSAWVLTTSPKGLPDGTPGFTAALLKWPERIKEAPRIPAAFTTRLYLGEIGADGSVAFKGP